MKNLINQELEEIIVSELVVHPDRIPNTIAILKPSDFFDAFYKRIFSVIFEKRDKFLGIVSLKDFFKTNEYSKIVSITGTHFNRAFISEIRFEKYIEKLKELSEKRRMYNLSHSILEKLEKGEEFEKEKQELLDVKTLTLEETKGIGELLAEYNDNYYKKEEIIKTGFNSLDYLTGGFHRGDLITISSRSGIGKSILCLHFAIEALKQNKKVLYLNLEMSDSQMTERLIAIYGGVNALELRNRKVDEVSLAEASEKLFTDEKFKNFRLLSSSRINSFGVLSLSAREQRRNGLDLLVVDYLGRLNDEKGKGTEEERLTQIVRNLKNTALRLDVPIIVPTQIDKLSAQKNNPEVEDSKGSTSIAHEADLALAIRRERTETATKLYITKNRQGQCGVIDLVFNLQTLCFTELTKKYE